MEKILHFEVKNFRNCRDLLEETLFKMILVALKSVIILISISVIDADHHRDKRFLIFPRANPTRHQVASDQILFSTFE